MVHDDLRKLRKTKGEELVLSVHVHAIAKLKGKVVVDKWIWAWEANDVTWRCSEGFIICIIKIAGVLDFHRIMHLGGGLQCVRAFVAESSCRLGIGLQQLYITVRCSGICNTNDAITYFLALRHLIQ
jgi:hypothetical protein